jgi:hypothetical protein
VWAWGCVRPDTRSPAIRSTAASAASRFPRQGWMGRHKRGTRNLTELNPKRRSNRRRCRPRRAPERQRPRPLMPGARRPRRRLGDLDRDGALPLRLPKVRGPQASLAGSRGTESPSSLFHSASSQLLSPLPPLVLAPFSAESRRAVQRRSRPYRRSRRNRRRSSRRYRSGWPRTSPRARR